MRGFSDEERARIRERLIETGRELVVTYGTSKTTVEDITEPVGIAKPTFYTFFDAKADLYLEILQREMEEFVDRSRAELSDVESAEEGLAKFFWCYAEFAEGSPIVQEMVIEGEADRLMRNISPEKVQQVQQEGMAPFIPLIEELQAETEGPLADLEPLMVLSLMGSSIGLLTLHRDDLEQQGSRYQGPGGYYEGIQDVLISAIARGLTTPD